MRIERILVAVDFSPDALGAVDHARVIAGVTGAELLLLYVVDQTYLAGAPQLTVANPAFAALLDEQWRDAQAQMARLAAPLTRAHLRRRTPRVRTLVERGVPWQSIVETARRTGADLVVMGTRGRTGLAHLLIGSVAERVVRHAHCAVLTVRSQRQPRRRSGKGRRNAPTRR